MELLFNAYLDGLRRTNDKIEAALLNPNTEPLASGFRQAAQIYLTDQRRRYRDLSRGGGEWPDLALSTIMARTPGRGLRKAKEKLGQARTLKESLAARALILKEKRRRRLTKLRIQLGMAKTPEQSVRIRRQINGVLKKLHAPKLARKKAGSIQSLALPKVAILIDTATLFNSLSVGAPGNVQQPLSDGIRVGTAITYARHHQDPTIPGRPPQRRILVDPSPEASVRMVNAIGRAVLATVRQIQQSP